MGYADEPYNTTTHLLWFMGAQIAPDADPRYTWSPTSMGWWSGVLKGGSGPQPSTAAVAASTGVNPTETSYALYGHTIPFSVMGRARIGGEIIAGPYINNGLATFCISFGFPADPTGTRDLREIAFDSEVVWDSVGGFRTEAFTYRFYPGTLTQVADPVEITHWGADAIAYRPQMLIWFEDLPIANTKFSKIPYVSAVIGDSTGDALNFGEMFERIAASPFVEFDDFETTGITDGVPDGALILAQDFEFLQLIQLFGRFMPNWDILQTDKLRIVDRGSSVTADITLDKTKLMGNVAFSRAEPNSVPSVLELSTIDLDADYSIVPSRAQRPRVPVAVTTSVKTETAYLPVVMDASTRQAVVTYTKYHEEQRRKQIRFRAMAIGSQIEPGALVAIVDQGDDFQDEIFKVNETTHGADFTVECTAEAILRCDFGSLVDPYFDQTVLLLDFVSTVDQSSKLRGAGTNAFGTVVLDNTQSKFGGTSGQFDGASTVTYGQSTDFLLGDSRHFTVECWIRPTTVSAGTRFLIAQWGTLTIFPNLGWVLHVDGDQLAWNVSTSGTNNFNDVIGGTIVVDTWQHVAVDFDGTTTRIYINGVCVDSSTTSRDIFDAVVPVALGGYSTDPVFHFEGWIDEPRITNGVARYATDTSFPVPTAPFPRG